MFKQTVLHTVEEPDAVIEKVKEYFTEQECEIVEDEAKYKVEGKFPVYDNMRVKVKVEEAECGVYCIRIEKNSGGMMNFLSVFNEMKVYLDESNIIL